MDKAMIKINELRKKIEKIDVELLNLNKELSLSDSNLAELNLKESIKFDKKHLKHLKNINKRKIIILLTIISSIIPLYFWVLPASAIISFASGVYTLMALLASAAQIVTLIYDLKLIKRDPNFIRINNDIEEAQKKLNEIKEYKNTSYRSKNEILQDIDNKKLAKTFMNSEIQMLIELRKNTIEEFIISNNNLDSIINNKYEERISEDLSVDERIKIAQQTNTQFNDIYKKYYNGDPTYPYLEDEDKKIKVKAKNNN